MSELTFILKKADLDRVGELQSQITGIMDCICCASQVDRPDDAIPCATWAATTLLQQLADILNKAPALSEVSQ